MAAIRRSGTKAEVRVRKALHHAGFRFRKDYVVVAAGRRTRPDIVFTRQRLAVFIDGCFWHCCPLHGRQPTKNVSYWSPKLARNVERDKMQVEALVADGWNVIRIWEHVEVVEAAQQIEELITELRGSGGDRAANQ